MIQISVWVLAGGAVGVVVGLVLAFLILRAAVGDAIGRGLNW